MLLQLLLFLFGVCSLIDGTTSAEEVVKLTTPGIARTLQLPEDRLSNYNHTWIVESTPGTKISFKCEIVLLGSTTGCDENSFTFNDGVNEEKFCMYQNFILFSQENRGLVHIQLDEKGIGQMHCLVQSITGPHANEYENVKSAEVDSSEHGVTPGSMETSCKCGWTNKGPSGRIMHGKEARVNEFPWMVHLHILHEFGPIRYATSCGASILTPRHVLTAAHCVVAENTRFIAKPTNLILVLAEHDAREKTNNKRMITGEKIFIGDRYLDKGLEYDDIAVIFTRETIQFNDVIGPICLEAKPFSLLHKSLTIMGWGMTEEGQPSPYLRKAKARVMDTSVCGMKPWDLCTATMPSSLCVGDSGGPLVYLNAETNRYAQVALVSKVRPDCKGEASASTSTSYYYQWIQEVIRETEPSYSTCHQV